MVGKEKYIQSAMNGNSWVRKYIVSTLAKTHPATVHHTPVG